MRSRSVRCASRHAYRSTIHDTCRSKRIRIAGHVETEVDHAALSDKGNIAYEYNHGSDRIKEGAETAAARLFQQEKSEILHKHLLHLILDDYPVHF